MNFNLKFIVNWYKERFNMNTYFNEQIWTRRGQYEVVRKFNLNEEQLDVLKNVLQNNIKVEDHYDVNGLFS